MKKVVLVVLLLGITLSFTPWVCMVAWNKWACEFNLPQFNYWHWFFTVLAVRGMFGGIRRMGAKEGN